MFRQLIRAAVVICAVFHVNRSLAQDAKPATRDVDLVICLDVSGSMDGLLESAKVKLWNVVNELAKMKPTPNLRVGLYTHGGVGTGYNADRGWVKKELDLTTDLDEVYKRITPLRTSGSTEYVARVSLYAIEEQPWSKQKDAMRIIFVCGNETAMQDPKHTLSDVAKRAKGKQIVINTIYCGGATDKDAEGWQHFASMADGRSAVINQNKSTEVVIPTPFDKKLLELNDKINTTYVAYGVQGQAGAANQVAQDNNALGATKATGANSTAIARAESKAGALYRNDHWDLVDRMCNDKTFDVKTLKDSELPEELKKLKVEEREPYLKKKLAERDAIRKEISDLAAKRAQHISDVKKTMPKNDAEKALDEALTGMIRDQAAARGFTPGQSTP